TAAGSRNSARTPGSAVSSPLRARRTRSRTSSGFASVDAVFADTSLPPLAALVLVEPRGLQRGAGCQVGQVDQRLQIVVEGAVGGDFGPEGVPFGLALRSEDGVRLRRQLGQPARADVLAHDATADLLRARVVTPLVPGHFCYLRRAALFPSYPERRTDGEPHA